MRWIVIKIIVSIAIAIKTNRTVSFNDGFDSAIFITRKFPCSL